VTAELKTWFQNNSTLLGFLAAQSVAILVGAASILTYAVKLETRVSIMETRGAEYTVARLNAIDQRLTVLEGMTRGNKESIDRMVEVMTRELNKQQPR
jgi:hypothetical protein